MAGEPGQNKENLHVVPGDRYAERPGRTCTSGEIRLDADMAKLFDNVKGADGAPPTRGFRRAIYNESHPWRLLARYIVAAARAGATEETVMPILERLVSFARETFRKYAHRRRSA